MWRPWEDTPSQEQQVEDADAPDPQEANVEVAPAPPVAIIAPLSQEVASGSPVLFSSQEDDMPPQVSEGAPDVPTDQPPVVVPESLDSSLILISSGEVETIPETIDPDRLDAPLSDTTGRQ